MQNLHQQSRPCHRSVLGYRAPEGKPNYGLEMDATTQERMATESETVGHYDACRIADPVALFLPDPAAPRVDDGSRLPLSRPLMFYRDAAVPVRRHRLPRGVHSQPYGEGEEVWFTVTSDGKEGYWRFRETWESEDDIIEALGDELDELDPLPPSWPAARSVVGRSVAGRRLAWRDSVRVLPLHRES